MTLFTGRALEAHDTTNDSGSLGGQDSRRGIQRGDRIKIDSDGDEMIFSHGGTVADNEGREERTLIERRVRRRKLEEFR